MHKETTYGVKFDDMADFNSIVVHELNATVADGIDYDNGELIYFDKQYRDSFMNYLSIREIPATATERTIVSQRNKQ